MTVAVSERIELARRDVPAAAAALVQVLVDNPAQFALIAAGGLVAARAALNIVRPRTTVEFLALLAVLQVGGTQGIRLAIDRGWLNFRIRDEGGRLVPLRPAPEISYCGADCPGHTTGLPGKSCLSTST